MFLRCWSVRGCPGVTPLTSWRCALSGLARHAWFQRSRSASELAREGIACLSLSASAL